MNYSKLTYITLAAILLLGSASDAYAGWPKKKRLSRKAKVEALMASETPVPRPYTDSTRFILTSNEPSTPVVEIPAMPQPAVDVNANIRSEMSPFSMSLLDEALSHIGKRYRYGSSGPSTFDCSGFVMYCFRQMGISLPHNSRDLFTQGTNLEFMDEIRPGDLVFFRGRNVASGIGHVGIVTEANEESFSFVHASTSSGVIISNYNEPYYHSRYVGARRVNSSSF